MRSSDDFFWKRAGARSAKRLSPHLTFLIMSYLSTSANILRALQITDKRLVDRSTGQTSTTLLLPPNPTLSPAQ
jgi:hypothetical protein